MALVENGGDVGVIETVLILGAQGGGVQSRAVSLLGLPPETKRRTDKHTNTWSDSSLLQVSADVCPVHCYIVPPSVGNMHGGMELLHASDG